MNGVNTRSAGQERVRGGEGEGEGGRGGGEVGTESERERCRGWLAVYTVRLIG